jgi:protein KRI1
VSLFLVYKGITTNILCSNAHIIATHPRNVASVRRADSSRKEAREKKKEREAAKLLAKREEVKRLKSLKMRELKEKLDKIRMEGGLGKNKGKQKASEEDEGLEDYGALGELDLDGDWDPEQHDAQMKSLYAENEEYEASPY